MHFTAVLGHVGDGGAIAHIALGTDREKRVGIVLLLALVLGAYLGSFEDGYKGSGSSGLFDIRPPARFFALDQTHGTLDVEAELARGRDGLNGGGAGGADIIDDDDGGARLMEAFDALAGAVSLFGFANE